MALGQGISVYGGQQWGTVHVNNQPMIVLLVPFRKGGLGGGRGLGTMGTHQRFTSYLFLFFSSNPSAASSLSSFSKTRLTSAAHVVKGDLRGT